MEIKDPCENTIPGTEPIKVLSAPRLGEDGDYISWSTLTDSVDVATSSYGTQKCGLMSMAVYEMSTDLPVSFISFDPSLGAITMNPNLNTPLGMNSYYYQVTMLAYPGQFTKQAFQAEVTICEVKSILSNGAFINDRQTMWADDSIIVDATDAVEAFTQFPDCGYPIYIKPKVAMPNGDRELLPVPLSAQFFDEPNNYFFEF